MQSKRLTEEIINSITNLIKLEKNGDSYYGNFDSSSLFEQIFKILEKSSSRKQDNSQSIDKFNYTYNIDNYEIRLFGTFSTDAYTIIIEKEK